MNDRVASLGARLIRAGVQDRDRAEAALAQCSCGDELVDALAIAADPDLAVDSFARLVAVSGEEFAAAFRSDERLRSRLVAVLGASEALGEHLIRHPSQWETLAGDEPAESDVRSDLLIAVGADPAAVMPVASAVSAASVLRVAYRRALLPLAARDLVGESGLEDVAASLSELADAALEAALAIARAEHPDDARACRLAVIGMGKCGGRELNYVSDVDVIFVAEAADGIAEADALAAATRLASRLMRVCSEATDEGELWEVDAALRPEGKQGALVRTLRSHVDYYERWAKTWEFQALLKARPVAGDLDLGAAYVDAIAPFVWSAADRDGFVGDVQAMRRRVESTIPAKEVERQLKLGPGGLRDVEFSVQLLQLVHGRSDVMLRSSTTLTALEALATWGYVGRDDAATLGRAYRFLRSLEHRIQLHRLRRTHIVPQGDDDLRRLGRSLGLRSDPAEELTDTWRRHRREVRRLHEKLFYRPLLNAVARLDAGEARLTPEAAQQRLEALGYTDPVGALRHLEALTSGVTRRAAIQRTLLPVMLGWFADAPDPDAGLLAFRQVSDALGSTPWYLRLLRDESVAAERMATLLATSRYATDLLLKAPESVSLLADDAELVPRSREQLQVEVDALVSRAESPRAAVAALRSLRRRELLRISAADVLGLLDDVGGALTDVTASVIDGALAAIIAGALQPFPTRCAVIAMGRFGGAELGYGSDADVMFVHDPLPGVDDKTAADAAFAVASELRALLMEPSTDPPLEVDADLRPEGRQGPLVRTLASYAAYYARWSAPWESQALLRARPVAGDPELGEELIAIADPLRYPAGGLTEDDLREMRRLKARMESERLPRGVDPAWHTKLGKGGQSDVEWVVQVIQMQHAHAVAELRTTRTGPALQVAVEHGLVDDADEQSLLDAWRLATRIRNAVTLVRGSASDLVPTAGPDLARVARVLGYPIGDSGRLLEDYRRRTRRARDVVERLFYGRASADDSPPAGRWA